MTVPVGVPLPTAGLTLATKLTGLLAEMLLELAINEVLDGSATTVMETGDEALARSVVSPL